MEQSITRNILVASRRYWTYNAVAMAIGNIQIKLSAFDQKKKYLIGNYDIPK